MILALPELPRGIMRFLDDDDELARLTTACKDSPNPLLTARNQKWRPAKARRLDTLLVFPSTTHLNKPIELKKSWLNALKRPEVTNFRWHDPRHCTASYLAMGGASMVDIAAVLGHRTLDMVKRYAHLSDGHIANMNAKIFGDV